MPERPHLLFRNPAEGVIEYRPLPRAVFPPGDEEEEVVAYTRMRENFRTYRGQQVEQQELRHSARSIEIPQYIDYIEIDFFGPTMLQVSTCES